MVITAGQFGAGDGHVPRALVDEVEIDGVHYLRYTHADGRVEHRRLTDDEVKHLEGMANIKEALRNYGGPVAP